MLTVQLTWTGETLYQCSGCDKEFYELLAACSHILSHGIKEAFQNAYSKDIVVPMIVYDLDEDTEPEISDKTSSAKSIGVIQRV